MYLSFNKMALRQDLLKTTTEKRELTKKGLSDLRHLLPSSRELNRSEMMS